MNLEEYFALLKMTRKDIDRPFAIKLFRLCCKAEKNPDPETVQCLVQEYLPREGDIRVSEILGAYGSVTARSVDRAIRWLGCHHESVRDTLCGPCVQQASADVLVCFLDNAIPVRTEFDCFCCDLQELSTPSLFADFRSKYKDRLINSRYHPFSEEKEFWNGSLQELWNLFDEWYMEYTILEPSVVEGWLSVGECATCLGVSPARMLAWLREHQSKYAIQHGRCLVVIDDVKYMQDQWRVIRPVAELLAPLLEQIPLKLRKKAKTIMLESISRENHSWVLEADTFPQQQQGVLYTMNTTEAEYNLYNCLHLLPIIPLVHLKEATELSWKTLQEKIESGAITATKETSGEVLISLAEQSRIISIGHQYLLLDDIVLDCVDTFPSLFEIRLQKHRNDLIDFCERNDWWQMDYVQCSELPIDGKKLNIAILRTDEDQFKDRIGLWLRGYRRTLDERFCLLTDCFQTRFPKTAERLIAFEKNVHPVDSALLDMAQILLDSLQSELASMNDVEIEQSIVARFSEEATLVACDALVSFLQYGKYSKRRFVFDRTGIKINTNAYSVQDFAVMVAHVVNDDVICRRELIRKAVTNKKYADMWLYIALHIYASWRSTDYIRMLAPCLPYSPETVLSKVVSGELSTSEAIGIAEYFMAINRLHLNTPNKTKGTPGVPHLYFYCPQSCLETFGKILAVATAHYQLYPSAESFVIPVKDWMTVKRFFGEEFLAACGNCAFSGRRANKALLQSIEFVGREEGQLPPLVSYHLASIMRSHKINYGEISETTDIYLHDATFSGMTPEYVIYQMWERGVCSFVADAMLRICYGDQYVRLSVAHQTKAIAAMGLTNANVANILRCVQTATDSAVKTVTEVFQDKETVGAALETIALGHGNGKDSDTFCVLKAAGKPCAEKSRLSCMGCRYEIKTKALLLRYAASHRVITAMHQDMTELEKARQKYIYSEHTWPAMVEILTHMDLTTSNCEMVLYKNLIKEAAQYGIAGGCTL